MVFKTGMAERHKEKEKKKNMKKKQYGLTVVVLCVVILGGYAFYQLLNSDFETKSYSGGIAIIRYKGTERDVVIPEEIDGKKVLSLLGSFDEKTGKTTGVFEGNSTIVSVTIPGTVSYIGKQTFKDCPSLTSVVMADSVDQIAERAFQNCTALTSVRFPKGLRYIKESAFENCSSLKSIDIPETNKSLLIEASTFSNCIALERVSLPGDFQHPGINDTNFPFAGCSKIELPTGHASLDRAISIYTVLCKKNKSLEDYVWLRGHKSWDKKRLPLENYTIENVTALPKISPEFGSKPNGKIFFLKREDFGNTPNVVYARFDYLDHLLKKLPKELVEQYSLTTTAEVEYVILFSSFQGKRLAYKEASSSRTGYLYESDFVATLYKVETSTGIFKKVKDIDMVTNTPGKNTFFDLGSTIMTAVEPRLLGYFDIVRAMK